MKPFWITAEQLMKKTGFNKYELRSMRLNNPAKGFYKEVRPGHYLYDANKIPECLKVKI